MHKPFIAIHHFVARNKVTAISIALAFLIIFGYCASRIKFEEDITRLIPRSEHTDETARVLSQLNFADKITVIINAKENAGAEDMAATATAFLDSIKASGKYIKSVRGRIDDSEIQETYDFVYNNLPLFLEDKDYEVIAQRISSDSITNTVAANYRSIVSPSGLITKDFILGDPFGISFIALKKLQQVSMGDEFLLQDGFIITKDKSKLLIFLDPTLPSGETAENTVFAEQLERIKGNLDKQFKKTEIQYFGSTLIAVANAKQIKSDIRVTAVIALTVLMLIFMLYYRKVVIPLIILLPSVFGFVFAIALLYFLKGTISAISLGIGSILIGVTIDYALHILTHYKHNSNVSALYKDITKPLIMSSSTTAIAFICLLFVRSEALQDLGIFAAVSVMVTAVFSLLIIPHLYKPADIPHEKTIIDKLAGLPFHNNRPLFLLSLVLIAICCFTFNKVRFNNDISQLNYVPADIKEAEKSLESATSLASKSIYLASYGNSPEEVLRNNSNLAKELSKAKNSSRILSYSSIGGIVLPKKEQEQKIRQWNNFWTDARKSRVQGGLTGAGAEYGFKESAYEKFYTLLNTEFQTIGLQDYANVKALMPDEFISKKNGLYTISTLVKIEAEQRDALMAELLKKPKLLVIDRQQMNETFLGDLKTDFTALVNYSFIAIVLILFVFFRRIELVILSCIPILVTGLVTAGIMGIFDIRLNIFSTIVCTLVFGHGVDFSIFMTSALQKEYTYGRNEMATYRVSILLAVLTTVLGIGALIFAGHPALRSISSVSLIGVMAALVITFVCYPVLFRFFIMNRVKGGKEPFRLRTLIHSVLSFAYYGLGGFVLSLLSFIFLILFPAGRKWKMKVFRFLMSKFMKSVLYTNPFLIKRVLNPNNENFNKPAIIIANHTSFLDILAIGMLSPKLIYLVSDWVYSSPIFGLGVKLAGFYPVSKGLEEGVDHLREKVEKGYSLVIFPEGTRSEDNVMRRFHKGAFYLAEEFNLDIVPILIHGNSEILPKGDFIINDGTLTLKILDRIMPSDKHFGEGYVERSKKISRFFKEKYADMRNETEGPFYFKHKILNSFVYKEADVIKDVKLNLKENLPLYHRLKAYIFQKATILHIADDNGEMDILLALQSPQRKIISYIANADKREVARTNYLVGKREILYIDNIAASGVKEYDVIIVSKMPEGNEIPKNAQEIILIKDNKEIPGFAVKHKEADFVILTKNEVE